MAEAWHQHLANLSWWEQIDRFFFPEKYSCTVTYYNPLLMWARLGLLLAIITGFFTLAVYSYYYFKGPDLDEDQADAEDCL